MKYKLDVESGIEIYSAVGMQNFLNRRAGGGSTLFKKVFNLISLLLTSQKRAV